MASDSCEGSSSSSRNRSHAPFVSGEPEPGRPYSSDYGWPPIAAGHAPNYLDYGSALTAERLAGQDAVDMNYAGAPAIPVGQPMWLVACSEPVPGGILPEMVLTSHRDIDWYRTQLRCVVALAYNNLLRDVFEALRIISRDLLGNVERLGLDLDDTGSHDEHLALWHEFNNTWLVALQRQHDLTVQLSHQGQWTQSKERLMTKQHLEHLSDELLGLCDRIEKHGLVDYEMGVAEEEIVALLTGCLDVLPQIEK